MLLKLARRWGVRAGIWILLGGFAMPAQEVGPAGPEQPCGGQILNPRSLGIVSGVVLDPGGAVIGGAEILLVSSGCNPQYKNTIKTDGEGRYRFAGVPQGEFRVTGSSAGFASESITGILTSGQTYEAPALLLPLASASSEIQVTLSQQEIAGEQIQAQERQRLLGVIPNYFTSYAKNAVPLTSKQKFELAWKTSVDPVSFGINGIIAGVQQANNNLKGYGQGAEGYGKRYGASYANFVSGTMIGSAILPSLLKQDPRYFYKGTGSVRSRVLYAMANTVICKGDNRRWQVNYSNIVGNLAAGGISNLYYPDSDRNGAGVTLRNGLLGIAAGAAANVIQEFLFKKITPGVPKDRNTKP